MSSIANYHVIDPKNVGDLLSAPMHYFSFPGHSIEQADIRSFNSEAWEAKHLIVGGGGLLYEPFLNKILALKQAKGQHKIIAWGVGQQDYGQVDPAQHQAFDYGKYLAGFDLAGIRDFGCHQHWVPCASCMHPAFDQPRQIKHEFVVFSHKKFQLKISPFPTMTHETNSLEQVLDFLGSGETVLTSSYHGAYWATLLGRKVLAFPFSSKFYTLKHRPAIFPIQKWRQNRTRITLFQKSLFEWVYKNKFSCAIEGWQDYLQFCRPYPESLAESRASNQNFYAEVMQRLAE